MSESKPFVICKSDMGTPWASREDVRGAEYFLQGHQGGSLFDKWLGEIHSASAIECLSLQLSLQLLQLTSPGLPRLLGRELQPPWVPKASGSDLPICRSLGLSRPVSALQRVPSGQGETYCDPEELDVSLSRALSHGMFCETLGDPKRKDSKISTLCEPQMVTDQVTTMSSAKSDAKLYMAFACLFPRPKAERPL